MTETPYVSWLADIGSDDIALVGGKNASLGEMIGNLDNAGINVPPGFATTARAYWEFLDHNQLRDKLARILDPLKRGKASPEKLGKSLRAAIEEGEMPPAIAEAIAQAYRELAARKDTKNLAVAVRSSATAEDLPTASFAGQLESFLNIVGETALIDACRRAFASLFTDRAISYREEHERLPLGPPT